MKEIYVLCYLSRRRTFYGFKTKWNVSSMKWKTKNKAQFAWKNRRESGLHDNDKEMIVKVKENGEMSVFKHSLKQKPDLKKMFEKAVIRDFKKSHASDNKAGAPREDASAADLGNRLCLNCKVPC